MLLFCPTCGTMLMFERGHVCNEFKCHKCGYAQTVSGMVTHRVYTKAKAKQVSGPIANEEGPSTEVTCPECHNDRAYFAQVQTRSADEPMTIFYKCTSAKCHHQWRE